MLAKSYQDLLNEIQFYHKRIWQLNYQKRWILSRTFRGPQGYRTDTSIEPTGVRASNQFLSPDQAEKRIGEIESIIIDCQMMLQLLQEQIAEINELLYRLEGRQYKVFWMHKCENKSFTEVASELGMSSRQVQRIYKEVAGDE